MVKEGTAAKGRSSSKALGWGELPNVALVEVYKNLSSVKDRLNAASVCWNWRDSGFQVPLTDTLYLQLNDENDIAKVIFLSQQFIRKVAHVSLTFDICTPACLDVVQEALTILEDNHQLKTLKVICSENCLGYLQNDNQLLTHDFVLKVLSPLLKVVQAKNLLETLTFPLIQNLSSFTGNNTLSTLLNSRNRFSISNISFPSLRTLDSFETSIQTLSGLNNVQAFVKLQILSISHDYLTDEILGKLGFGSVAGGLKRLSLVAEKGNPLVSAHGWSVFVANNPDCKVRLTVKGGSGLVSHSSNLIFQNIPLSHFRTYHCKEMRINFLNSVIGWNIDTLEHLELVDDDCDWIRVLTQLNSDDDQFLDPIVYAAWRCKQLHTIKIGLLYCGDSLVGIARLKGPSLLKLEIPKSHVVHRSLNLKKLNKEISNALERPWRPITATAKELSCMKCDHLYEYEASLSHSFRAVQPDEL